MWLILHLKIYFYYDKFEWSYLFETKNSFIPRKFWILCCLITFLLGYRKLLDCSVHNATQAPSFQKTYLLYLLFYWLFSIFCPQDLENCLYFLLSSFHRFQMMMSHCLIPIVAAFNFLHFHAMIFYLNKGHSFFFHYH